MPMIAGTRPWADSTRRWKVTPSGRHGNWERSVVPARVLFINQYYWPDHASTAQHLTDLAESLAEQGHEVHVLCSRGGYKPGQPPLPSREVQNGVEIRRVGATSLGRRSLWMRYADYFSFYALAAWKALALPRFDVVVTLTTPPLIGLVGTLLRRLRGSSHVCWSMDLHPDASLALGMMSRANPVVRLLAWLGDAIVRSADRVVVLGAYMADRILAKNVRPPRLVTIPVWSRRDEVVPLPREGHPLREALGLGDRFVAMYSGNLGLAHDFGDVLEAARRLRGREDIVFLFVGDGPRLDEVLRAKQEDGLENVRLLGYFPREQLRDSLSLADVHLITLRREMTGIVVPGKLYGAMASGRPALFVGPEHCESADAVREAECGVSIRPGDVAGIVSTIERLAADPTLAGVMGERGRAAFLERYERATCCARWCRVIGEVVGHGARVPAGVVPLARLRQAGS
jgi:glycosyltransferase involved in cell wall biosynthesis